MSKFGHWVASEIREIIPPTLFFLIAFHVMELSEQLMVEQYAISLGSSASATIGALVVAKAILVADALPFVDLFPNRPRAWNVVWKTLLYSLVSLLFRFLEELLPKIGEAGGLGPAVSKVMTDTVWPHFWALQLLLTLFLAIYCILDELVAVLGGDEVQQIFLGRKLGRSG